MSAYTFFYRLLNRIEELEAVIADNVPCFAVIDEGLWNENTGDVILSEDQADIIRGALNELVAAIPDVKETPLDTRDLLLKWLDGEPIVISDQVYVFPHGVHLVKKWINKEDFLNEKATS